VQGLVGKSYNKLASQEMIDLFKTHDILLFTETWSSESYDYSVEGFTHYVLHRKLLHKHSRRENSGLIIYISDNINNHVSLLKNENDSMLWMKIDKNLVQYDKDILLCLMYIVPTGSTRESFISENIFDCMMTF